MAREREEADIQQKETELLPCLEISGVTFSTKITMGEHQKRHVKEGGPRILRCGRIFCFHSQTRKADDQKPYWTQIFEI